MSRAREASAGYAPLFVWWELLEILAPFLLSILGPAAPTAQAGPRLGLRGPVQANQPET